MKYVVFITIMVISVALFDMYAVHLVKRCETFYLNGADENLRPENISMDGLYTKYYKNHRGVYDFRMRGRSYPRFMVHPYLKMLDPGNIEPLPGHIWIFSVEEPRETMSEELGETIVMYSLEPTTSPVYNNFWYNGSRDDVSDSVSFLCDNSLTKGFIYGFSSVFGSLAFVCGVALIYYFIVKRGTSTIQYDEI